MVVVSIITITTHPGKRDEVLSHLQDVAEYAEKFDKELCTFLVLLSEAHPDRFSMMRSFQRDPTRYTNPHKPIFKLFWNKVAVELKLVQYSTYTEHAAFGWICRHEEGGIDADNKRSQHNIVEDHHDKVNIDHACHHKSQQIEL